MSDAIKTAFITAALQEYMRMTIRDMRTAIGKKKVGSSGAASASLDSEVTERQGQLKFREYLRFVDMGVGKSAPLGGLKATKVALQSSNQTGYSQEANKSRKAKKIYSKVAYGNLSWLQGKILYGYTQETIAMLKKELEGSP